MSRHRPIPLLLALALLLAAAADLPRALAQTPGAAAPAADQPPALRFTVRGFEVKGVNPLSPARTREVLAPFEGEYSGIEGLYEAANTLEKAIGESGHSFHRVVLPAQTLKDGTVVLEVVAFKLGKIVVKGNEHFSEENILRSMPGLVRGEVPRTRLLSQQRHIANLHPSKNVELRLRESTTQQAIDAHLAVEDSDPQFIFLGLNNTGNNATGDFRLLGGFQHRNLSGRDDQVAFSVTTSPTKIDQVEQLGISYALPFYDLGGQLNAYAATTDVSSGTVASLDIAGAGTFMGVSYTHHLQRQGAYTHSVTAGVDDKRFVNDARTVASAGSPSVPLLLNVRSRPLTLSYDASYEHARGLSTFHVSYVRNIPRGRYNHKDYYSDPSGRFAIDNLSPARAGSDPVWDLVRFGATADVNFPGNWLLRWRGNGQLTHQPLISGEQFGIGGARSVRGYEERELAGDVGFSSSLEAWSSPLFHGVRAIGFVDVGHRRSRKVLPGENHSDTLWGAGLGLRWFWKTNLSLEVDVALPFNTTRQPMFRNDNTNFTESGEVKVHFNTFYQF